MERCLGLTIAALPAKVQQAVRELYLWREPNDAIAALFGVDSDHLDCHFAATQIGKIRKTRFPPFENAGFLLLPASSEDYLRWIAERVARADCPEEDRLFCASVGCVAQYFLTSDGRKDLLD